MAQTLELDEGGGWDEVRGEAFGPGGDPGDAGGEDPDAPDPDTRGVQGRDPEQGRALHPWAREMYRKGLSFNGNERHRTFVATAPGRFVDLSDALGSDSPLDGRALVAADLDRDGDVDLFAHNIQRDRHSLWRNDLPTTGRSLALRLTATTGQHEAIGATVVVEGPRGPVAQVLARGSGFASGEGPELVYGLGVQEAGRVRVRWPGRTDFEDFGPLAAGAWRLVEGGGHPATGAATDGGRPTGQDSEPPSGPASGATRLERRAEPLVGPWPDGLKLGKGEAVPALVWIDGEGRRKTLEPTDIGEGEEVWVHFWASYCAPCVAELPELDGRTGPGRRVLALSLDGRAGRERARTLLRERAPHLEPGFVALDDEAGESGLDRVVDLLSLPVPTTLVLGPGGRLERVLQGSGALDR